MITEMAMTITKKITTIILLEGVDEPFGVEVNHFDEEGNLVLEEYPACRVEHSYLPDGQELECREYRQGVLYRREVFAYDDEGGRVGSSVYDTHGNMIASESWDWSHGGRVAHIIKYYHIVGRPPEKSRSMKYFDKIGRLVFCAEDGEFIKQEYDPSGNVCSVRWYRSGKLEDGFDCSYEYDDNGLWIRRYTEGLGEMRRVIEYQQ